MQMRRENPRALETIALKIKALDGLEGRVGWVDNKAYPSGINVAQVAAIQELGAPSRSIPPRPFLRPTAIKQQQKWQETATALAKQSITGNLSPVGMMTGICLQAQGDVYRTITELTEPPLSPITLELRAMKRRNPSIVITGATVGEAARRVKQPGYQLMSGTSEKPLIDSGLLLGTLSHEVVKT